IAEIADVELGRRHLHRLGRARAARVALFPTGSIPGCLGGTGCLPGPGCLPGSGLVAARIALIRPRGRRLLLRPAGEKRQDAPPQRELLGPFLAGHDFVVATRLAAARVAIGRTASATSLAASSSV